MRFMSTPKFGLIGENPSTGPDLGCSIGAGFQSLKRLFQDFAQEPVEALVRAAYWAVHR